MAIDLHHGREVRHLDALLAPSRLARAPAQPLPEARRLSMSAGHDLARAQAVRTVAALANVRARQLAEWRDRQAARVRRYYADLREELEEQAHRARNAEEAAARRQQRLAALEREEHLRLAEVEQRLGSAELYRDGERVKETTAAFEDVKQQLAHLYEHWEEAVELN